MLSLIIVLNVVDMSVIIPDVAMLSVVLLQPLSSIIILNVVMSNVVMPSVVALSQFSKIDNKSQNENH
jgi:hypothetical protein